MHHSTAVNMHMPACVQPMARGLVYIYWTVHCMYTYIYYIIILLYYVQTEGVYIIIQSIYILYVKYWLI